MRKVQEYLGTGDTLRRLTREAARLAALDRAYRRAVPAALAQASGIDHIDSATLVVWADSGAVGAKLRQLAPTLLGRLRELAPECTVLRVAVRICARGAGGSSRGAPARLGAGGAEALRELAGELPPSSLRTALKRLASRARSEDGQ